MPSLLALRSVLLSVDRFVLLSVDRFVLRFALEGVDTFLSGDFWCPPLIDCLEELLCLVEGLLCLVEGLLCLVDDCFDEDGLDVVAFRFDVLRLAVLADLEGVFARLADAPPRDALWRILCPKQSSGITRARVNRKANAVISFL